MTVTLNPPTEYGGMVRLTWSTDLGGTPTFYVYVDGILVSETTSASYSFYGTAGESYFFEVFDATPHTPTTVPLSRARLCWYPVDDAEEYRIEELVAGTWTEREHVFENGSWWYSWWSSQLADGALHRFRVRAVAEDLYLGDVLETSFFIVRFPDEPEVDYSYDSGTAAVTIAEA